MKPQELNSFEFRLEVVSRRGSIAKQPHQLGNGDCIYGGLGKSGAWESPGPGPVVDLPLDLALDESVVSKSPTKIAQYIAIEPQERRRAKTRPVKGQE